MHFISFINTSSSNYNIFERIRNTQNIPPQMTINTTNVVFLMAWILVFMKCESKLCAISLRATSRSSFRYSSHCWQRLKETDETSIAYIQQNVHHPRKYQVFFFVVYLTAEKKITKGSLTYWDTEKDLSNFHFLIFLKCPCNCIELSPIKELKCTYTGGCYCQCFHKLKTET